MRIKNLNYPLLIGYIAVLLLFFSYVFLGFRWINTIEDQNIKGIVTITFFLTIPTIFNSLGINSGEKIFDMLERVTVSRW